jgi:long-chain acyl-CoA synthetase
MRSNVPSSDVDDAWGSEIAEVEVLGYPCLSFVKRRRHLADLLIDGRRFGAREYIVQGERRVSFDQHQTAVRRAVRLLQERGVRPGDRVMLFGANSVEWVIGYWAILETGAIVVLGNAWWSQVEIEHALRKVAPSLVLADAARAKSLPDSHPRLTFADLGAAISAGGAPPLTERPPANEDDPAVVLFTSGTTGLPKGAVLSHRGILATLQSLAVLTRRLPVAGAELPPPSRSLLSIPLFHVGGLQQIITPMLSGGTLVFAEGRFDPERIVDLLGREQVAVWSTVPTMVSRVMDWMEEKGHPGLERVRTVGLGGSPVGMQLRHKVPRWFPNASRGLSVTYGLSEGGGVLVTAAGAELLNRPGAVGKPLKVVTLRIDQPDREGCGEIVVRSPSVMLGYWPDPDRPYDAGPITPDRWLHTGDIGRLDEDGYLYVTDRSKDIVIRGGENIATPNVENRLMEHPAVREVAVIGLPHEHLGEEVAAVVVLAEGNRTSPDELAAFAAEGLAYFEIPTQWEIRYEALPQNATGKILKRQLRDEWIAQGSGARRPPAGERPASAAMKSGLRSSMRNFRDVADGLADLERAGLDQRSPEPAARTLSSRRGRTPPYTPAA